MLYIPENDSACLRSGIYVFVKVTQFVRRMCEIETEFINVILFSFALKRVNMQQFKFLN